MSEVNDKIIKCYSCGKEDCKELTETNDYCCRCDYAPCEPCKED